MPLKQCQLRLVLFIQKKKKSTGFPRVALARLTRAIKSTRKYLKIIRCFRSNLLQIFHLCHPCRAAFHIGSLNGRLKEKRVIRQWKNAAEVGVRFAATYFAVPFKGLVHQIQRLHSFYSALVWNLKYRNVDIWNWMLLYTFKILQKFGLWGFFTLFISGGTYIFLPEIYIFIVFVINVKILSQCDLPEGFCSPPLFIWFQLDLGDVVYNLNLRFF